MNIEIDCIDVPGYPLGGHSKTRFLLDLGMAGRDSFSPSVRSLCATDPNADGRAKAVPTGHPQVSE